MSTITDVSLTVVKPLLTPEQQHAMACCPETVTAIATSEHFIQVAEALKDLKAADQTFETYFTERKRRARQVHQDWLDAEKDTRGPIQAQMTRYNTLITDYHLVLKRADEERDRALQAAAHADEETRVVEEAAQLEQYGAEHDDPESIYLANELLESPVAAPTSHAPASTPEVAGIKFAENKYAPELVSRLRVIKHVAEHPEFEEVLEVSKKKLRQLCNTHGIHLAKVLPGTRAVPVYKAKVSLPKKPYEEA